MATISKTGIQDGLTSKAEHITRIIDALDGTATTQVVATGSFTGSFQGDGSGLTNIPTPNAVVTASNATNDDTIEFLKGGGGTFSITVNNIETAQTASYVLNAVSSSYATTASYVVGGVSEYMTLRLNTNEKLNDTAGSGVIYVGSAGVSTNPTRTGLMIPYDCMIVSASFYVNAPEPANSTSTLNFRLYKNVDTSPEAIAATGPVDLQQNYDGASTAVGAKVDANTWINFRIYQNNDSTCKYFVTCDVLIKKNT